ALGDLDLEVEANVVLGAAYHSLGYYGRAIECATRSIAAPADDRLRDHLGLVTLPSVLGRYWLACSLSERGEFDRAITHARDAVRLAEEANRPSNLVSACMAVGQVQAQQGKFQDGIPWLQRGLEICDARAIGFLRVGLAAELGYAYALAGRWVEALPLLEQAVELAISMKRERLQSLRVGQLSEAYDLAGRREDALAYARRGLTLAHARGERGSQAWVLRLLGEIGARAEPPDVEQAESYYRQALALADELGMRPLVAHCHLGLGTLYQRVGRDDEARAELTTAAEMHRAMEMTFWLEQAEAALTTDSGTPI